ncbi:MAG: hypothetical protein L0L22_13750 [Staphylococcus equorum]|nr:hypothetical protein [Staphylococcus equorum]
MDKKFESYYTKWNNSNGARKFVIANHERNLFAYGWSNACKSNEFEKGEPLRTQKEVKVKGEMFANQGLTEVKETYDFYE